MPEEVKVPKIPDTETAEEIVVEVPIPSTTSVAPNMLIETKRHYDIQRGDNDRMTTDSNRFVEN